MMSVSEDKLLNYYPSEFIWISTHKARKFLGDYSNFYDYYTVRSLIVVGSTFMGSVSVLATMVEIVGVVSSMEKKQFGGGY